MTYTPTLGIAKTVQLTVTTLVSMSAVTTFCGLLTPSERIIVGDGGFEVSQYTAWARVAKDWAPPAIVVSAEQADDRMPGLGSWREDGAISVALYHKLVAGDLPPDAYLRVLDEVEGILQGFRDASRTGTLVIPSARIIEMPRVALPTVTAPWRGSYYSRIQLSFARGVS